MAKDITYSEISTFKRCPFKWYLQYEKQLSPKRISAPLQYGSYIHHLLATFYECQQVEIFEPEEIKDVIGETSEEYFEEKSEGMFEEEKVEFVDMKEMAEKQMDLYVDKYIEDLGKYKVLAVEQPFAIAINDDYVLNGVFDLILQSIKTGQIYLGEHKTTSFKIDVRLKDIDLDDQISFYSWALMQTFNKDKRSNSIGTIYNIIRKKLPAIPQVLKNGKGISQSKGIDTTYDVYYKAIIDNGFNPEDYNGILSIIKANGDQFFGRELTIRTKEELEITHQELVNVCKHIKRTKSLYKNSMIMQCPIDCAYRTICLQDKKGQDWDLSFFEKREYRHPEVEEAKKNG